MMAWAITISDMGRTAPIRRYSTDDPYSIFVGGALFSCWRDASAHLLPGSATRGAAVPGAMVGCSRSHSRRWTAGLVAACWSGAAGTCRTAAEGYLRCHYAKRHLGQAIRTSLRIIRLNAHVGR